MIKFGWVLVTIALAASRLYGFIDNRFQAFAHLVVGGFFGAWFADPKTKRFYLGLGVFLTILEVVAFLMGIGKVDGR